MIGQVIDNLNAVLDDVNARDQELSELISSLQALVSGLAEDREPIGEAIVSIGELTERHGRIRRRRPARAARRHRRARRPAENLNGRTRSCRADDLRTCRTSSKRSRGPASYGSWFNFYLCELRRRRSASGPILPPVEIPAQNAGRCSADGVPSASPAAGIVPPAPELPAVPGLPEARLCRSAGLPRAPELPVPLPLRGDG